MPAGKRDGVPVPTAADVPDRVPSTEVDASPRDGLTLGKGGAAEYRNGRVARGSQTFAWLDTLAAPLSRGLRSTDWSRVERGRDGTWLYRARSEVPRWYRRVSDGVAELRPEDDARLRHLRPAVDAWRARDEDACLISWRVGRRAVFAVTPRGGPTRYAKLYAKDRGILARWRILDREHGRCAGSWRAAEVVRWDARRAVLETAACDGVSLHDRWVAGRAEPGDGDPLAALLDRLASAAIRPDVPEHGVSDEIRTIETSLERAVAATRRFPREARALADRVIAALRDDAGRGVVRTVACHRDLHDKQVFPRGTDGVRDTSRTTITGGTVIDFDLAAPGPPALDAGNLLAHVRLRALQGLPIPWRDVAAPIARFAADGGLRESLSPWTAASSLRLATLYALRERRAGLVADLLGVTDDALERRGDWDGIL